MRPTHIHINVTLPILNILEYILVQLKWYIWLCVLHSRSHAGIYRTGCHYFIIRHLQPCAIISPLVHYSTSSCQNSWTSTKQNQFFLINQDHFGTIYDGFQVACILVSSAITQYIYKPLYA